MSAMEMAEESTSRLDEENKSDEKMAQVYILRQLFDRISSPPISELMGELKLGKCFLNTLKTNLLRLDAILDDAESKAYGKEEVKLWLHDPQEVIKEQRWFHDPKGVGKEQEWLYDLKEVGYDLEDLLDEIATEILRHQLESKTSNIVTWLQRRIVPSISSRLEMISDFS